MAKSFIFLILILILVLALLLLSVAQSRVLSTTTGQQAQSQIPFSNSPEFSSLSDDDCKGLDGEECLIRRSLAAHTDYIYTQENTVP